MSSQVATLLSSPGPGESQSKERILKSSGKVSQIGSRRRAGRENANRPPHRSHRDANGRPPAEVLTAQTSLDDLCPQADQRFDAIRALSRYVYNRHHLGGTWWAWMWEARALLQANWQIVEALAERLLTVDAVHLDGGTGDLAGQVNGEHLLHWCGEVGAPVLNADDVSISY